MSKITVNFPSLKTTLRSLPINSFISWLTLKLSFVLTWLGKPGDFHVAIRISHSSKTLLYRPEHLCVDFSRIRRIPSCSCAAVPCFVRSKVRVFFQPVRCVCCSACLFLSTDISSVLWKWLSSDQPETFHQQELSMKGCLNFCNPAAHKGFIYQLQKKIFGIFFAFGFLLRHNTIDSVFLFSEF